MEERMASREVKPSLPLENIDPTHFKITKETLDEALRILRKVLDEEASTDE